MGEVMIPTPAVGEPAIWIEVLSRLHHDVAARYRFSDVPITIGRAYDNDVVVDDPHVAAHHLRITRGENGQCENTTPASLHKRTYFDL